MTSTGVEAVVGAMLNLGFKKRTGMIFTRSVAEGVLGWVGLNQATRRQAPGHVEVNPVIGIRHQQVERIVAQLRHKKFHPYIPPTVSRPLGYLMPEANYRTWVLGAVEATQAQSADLVGAILSYGQPFMESGSTLPGLCRLIEDGVGFDFLLNYRRPVALALAVKQLVR